MADELDDRDLKQTLNAWRESADKQAEREDWFWARQQARITAKMDGPRVRRMPAVAWAGIAATVAIGAALMMPGNHPPQNDSLVAKNTPPVQAPMSDHELMQELEQTMNSGVPDALQPASTLAQEMEQAYSAKTTSKGKESRQ